MDTKTKLKYYPFLTSASPLARQFAKFFVEDQKQLVIDSDLHFTGSRNTRKQGITIAGQDIPPIPFPLPKILDLGDYCRIKGSFSLERIPYIQKIICKRLIVEGYLNINWNDQLSSIVCDELIIEPRPFDRKRWYYNARSLTIKSCYKLKSLPKKMSCKEIELNNISIQSLPQLEGEITNLNIYSCGSLKNFPTKLEAEEIDIRNCPAITSLPKIRAESLEVSSCANLRQISKETEVSHLGLSGKMELNHVPERIQLEADSLDIPKKLRLQLEKTPKKGVYKNIQKARKKPKCVRNTGRHFR